MESRHPLSRSSGATAGELNMAASKNKTGAINRMVVNARYAKWLPAYAWQRITRRMRPGKLHVLIALADHFEPSIVPDNGRARAPHSEQERRVERWCSEYPSAIGSWRDHDGRPLVHTYFYPAEQYEFGLVDRLAEHCHEGWGEIEIHLHHGTDAPASAAETREVLQTFRDALVNDHGCLSFVEGSHQPRYAFVHGNFALANATGGYGCGVDDEMQILADTGCYADFTMPAATFHPAQIAKVNSMYESGLSLRVRAPHRKGRHLAVGHAPKIFPLNIQGPLMFDFDRRARNRIGRIDNAALTGANPPNMRRFLRWKKACICVRNRPDWLFIKLHTHSMDPTQREAVIGPPMQRFLTGLVQEADDRKEAIHFVTTREMVNIILAACDGREGNPGEYRDYKFKRTRENGPAALKTEKFRERARA